MRSGDEQLSLPSTPLSYRQVSFSTMDTRQGSLHSPNHPPPPPPPPTLQSASTILQPGRRPPTDCNRNTRSALSAPCTQSPTRMDRETLQLATARLRPISNDGSLRGDESSVSNGRMDRKDQYLSGRDWQNGTFPQSMERNQAGTEVHVTSNGTNYSGSFGHLYRHPDTLNNNNQRHPSRLAPIQQQYYSSSSSCSSSIPGFRPSSSFVVDCPMQSSSSSSSAPFNSGAIRNPREFIHAYATQTPAASLIPNEPGGRADRGGAPPKPQRDPSALFARQLRDQGLTITQKAANQAQHSELIQRPLPSNISQLYQNQNINRIGGNRIDQVDVLIRKMEQNMRTGDGAAGEYNCVKCGEGVSKEKPGCTALEQTFHIACFTCSVCGNALAGASFYNVSGMPMCDRDYQNTLEKCAGCGQAIAERLLRASGKAFHPNCFVCKVCNKSLDSVPFTVDPENVVHCVPCYQDKYAPRCAKCCKAIVPQQGEQESVRVIAMDRSFHVGCYTCEDCHVQLSTKLDGEGCYPMDDHLLCKTCNVNRIRGL